jgi:hypothetical protein
MKTTNHTPGPWEAKDQWGYIKVHSAENGVCVIHGLDSKAQANANLIASAPDLLSALRFLLADYVAIEVETLTGSSVPVEMARAAIAKAEGAE